MVPGQRCKYRNERLCTYVGELPGSCPGNQDCKLRGRCSVAESQANETPERRQHRLDKVKEYAAAHQEEIKAQQSEYMRGEKFRAYDKKRRSYPVNIVTYGLNHHARKGHKVEVTVEYALELYLNTKTCRYCGVEMKRAEDGLVGTTPSIDRIDNGDTLTKDNIQYICLTCNKTKGAYSHDEYMVYLRQMVKCSPE